MPRTVAKDSTDAMAKPRALVKRRKSVRNIRKITRTMQLIATARFQAALNRATATKPYTEKLAELVEHLVAASGELKHELVQPPDENVQKSALLIITSQRGLCGGYNMNVLRAALGWMDERPADSVDTHIVGKKGVGYFRFLRRPVASSFLQLSDTPRFDQIGPIADEFMRAFKAGEIGSAHVAFMRFHSMGQQRPEVIQLLPLRQETVAEAAGDGEEGAATTAASHHVAEYEMSPDDPQAMLDELLPATVRAQLFQCFNDANVSEHIARMVAMKAATDAAGDMIKSLTRQYNRARQTQITMELLDIVGGANALA
jgi:F-type H+-transporting ATPase subunit gamma